MENKYEKGKWYDGLGKYLGIITTVPYKTDYVIREHKFSEMNSNGREVSKINSILIDKPSRSEFLKNV